MYIMPVNEMLTGLVLYVLQLLGVAASHEFDILRPELDGSFRRPGF